MFDRSHQGIELTPLGEAFLEKAAEVDSSFRELELISESCDEKPVKLRLFLVAPAFCNNAKARANMAAFFDKHLNARTETSIGTGEAGLDALRAGSCDALITIGPLDRPGFDCFPMGTVPAGICMAANHPLARQNAVSLEQLEPYRVISSRTFDHFNESILVMYREDGLKSPIVEPLAFDAPRQFYVKHAVCFMVNIAPLGETLPRSRMVPLASKMRRQSLFASSRSRSKIARVPKHGAAAEGSRENTTVRILKPKRHGDATSDPAEAL